MKVVTPEHWYRLFWVVIWAATMLAGWMVYRGLASRLDRLIELAQLAAKK